MGKSSYNSDTNISDNAFIPTSHDKKLEKNEEGKYTVVRNESTGRLVEWNFRGTPSNQPINNAKINDPDFLNNEKLAKENIEATFIIPDTPYNQNLKAENNFTYENAEIHIYQGDTFIGTVPNIYENKQVPENFHALRKTVFNQQQGTTQGIQVATSINPKLRETLNSIGYSNTKIDSLTKEEIEYISKNKIPAEEFVSREENIKENFENITKQLEDLVKESIIPGSQLNEMMSKFMDETGQFKKC